MEKIITYENLRSFSYSNDKLIKGKIKGIVVEFTGLSNMQMYKTDSGDAHELAEEGILYIIPYNHPWCWMNDQAVRYTDEIIDVLVEHYGLGDDVKIVSSGGSMGGLGALTYCVYAARTPVACVANCPVCDLPYHFTEREDLPRTLYGAFYNLDGTLDDALKSRSPIHLVDRMPNIPYTVLHATLDEAVNKAMHSDRFVTEMKKRHNVTYIEVAHRGHCSLSIEARAAQREAILSAFAD